MNTGKFRFSFIVLTILFLNTTLFSQIYDPVKWTFKTEKISDKEVDLLFIATIEDKWHLYSQDIPENGPIATSFNIDKNDKIELIGKVKEPKPIVEEDPNFKMVLKFFAHKAVFKQRVKLLTDDPVTVKGWLEFMCCDDSKCLPPSDEDFEFKLNLSGSQTAETASTEVVKETDTAHEQTETTQAIIDNDKPIEGDTETENNSLLWFFIIAFGAGLLAILTPCVFPMIPMTVTFFMHGSENKSKGISKALVYGISIVGIYTAVGSIIAITMGPEFANWLSTHWLPNILFFLIFIFFAASFFGMFEITMPTGLINKADKQADRGGYLGAFFMAFTLVLVSFSCTGPIVGMILVESAGGEQILKPIVGMLGFSLAFALPFSLFAVFPSWLSNLPKSGGWLNSVKVVLGFIELALGLKFLSIADQTYHWHILDREIYLAFWIVILLLMGLYLLGKLKFAHDSDLPYISVPRLGLAICTLSFVVYLIPGMFGAPLKAISGYLPPQTTHDFDLNEIIRDNASIASSADKEKKICEIPKYSEFLHLPHGLEGYFDYEQGLACAKELNKPIFIDFTGHGCVNCREMESNVWSHPKVIKKLQEDFLIIALYVDDKKKLPESEWITSTYDGKVKKTIGKIYADFQITKFRINAQPYYVLLDHNGELLTTPKAYDKNVNNFIEFLDKGIEEFKKR